MIMEVLGMTDIERRALLGDRQAQEECTRNGIVLACPFCGNKNIRTSNWGMWRCWCPECFGKSEDSLRERDAVKHWNTRPAPPLGRCKDCEHYTLLGHCKIHSQEPDEHGPGAYVEMLPDDFCSYFEPKENEENE